jgi:hypothetical protein
MNEDSKLILSAYRPSGQDVNDPAFSEALANVANDPALAEWFGDQQAFDRAIAQKLAEVPVPAALRDRIRAGASASRPRRWWRIPQLWMAAAAFTVLAVVASLMSRPQGRTELAAWQKHALSVLDQLEHGETGFDQRGSESGQLVAWLRERSAPAPTAIPAKLSTHGTYGCKTWQWDGHQISLMCFNAGKKGGVHLFTTDRGALASAPPEGKPAFARHGPWFVASWSKDQNAYMLAGEEGEPMLRELLVYRDTPRQIAWALPVR